MTGMHKHLQKAVNNGNCTSIAQAAIKANEEKVNKPFEAINKEN